MRCQRGLTSLHGNGTISNIILSHRSSVKMPTGVIDTVHVRDEVNQLVRVAPLVVVPCDALTRLSSSMMPTVSSKMPVC